MGCSVRASLSIFGIEDGDPLPDGEDFIVMESRVA